MEDSKIKNIEAEEITTEPDYKKEYEELELRFSELSNSFVEFQKEHNKVVKICNVLLSRMGQAYQKELLQTVLKEIEDSDKATENK